MADTLQDVIRKRLTQQPTLAEYGAVPGQTQQLQSVLQAKAGKAVTPSTAPAPSAIAEQAALSLGEKQMKQVQQAGEMKAAQQELQAAEQEQSKGLQFQELEQKKQAFRQEAQRNLENIYAEAGRAEKELDLNKYKSSLEQAGFYERLRNDKYLTNLQMEGDKQRLNTELGFKRALLQDSLIDAQNLMGDQMAHQVLFNQNARQFDEELAKMDLNTASAILASKISAANQQAIFGGIEMMVQGGAKAYSQYTPTSKTSPQIAEKSSYSYEQPTYGKSAYR